MASEGEFSSPLEVSSTVSGVDESIYEEPQFPPEGFPYVTTSQPSSQSYILQNYTSLGHMILSMSSGTPLYCNTIW